MVARLSAFGVYSNRRYTGCRHIYSRSQAWTSTLSHSFQRTILYSSIRLSLGLQECESRKDYSNSSLWNLAISILTLDCGCSLYKPRHSFCTRLPQQVALYAVLGLPTLGRCDSDVRTLFQRMVAHNSCRLPNLQAIPACKINFAELVLARSAETI